MGSLILNRRDIEFLLYEWLNVESLLQRERFTDHTRESFDAALETYESIANDFFAPHNKKNDEEEPQFANGFVSVNPEVKLALDAFSKVGLMAARQSFDLGGMQLPAVVERAGFAYMLAANAGTAGYAFLTIANSDLLLEYGTPEQIDTYVRPMMEGRFFGTMCLSEPQAGSSLADIKTRAEPGSNGEYRLFGNKMWISGGDQEISENIIHLVLAKIPGPDGKLRAGIGGISLFLVPKFLIDADGNRRNDVVVAGVNHKMGYRGTVNTLLNFGEGKYRPDGMPGAVGYLVGAEGDGLKCMFHMMNEARIGVGLTAVALGYTGYLHSLDYARNRPQGRLPQSKDPIAPQVPIIKHTDVKRMLLAQKAYVEGGMALALYSARLVDEQNTASDEDARFEARQLLDLLTPITKSWPSQWCLAANDLAIQVHGGYGYTREYNVEQFYRDNRLNQIHEGTHGIQGLDLLGRKVNQNSGAGMLSLGLAINKTIANARHFERLNKFGEQLNSNWLRMRDLTVAINKFKEPSIRLANASLYLETFGQIVVAWIWLEQACVALTNFDNEPEFYSGKLAACGYFFEWELSRTAGMFYVLEKMDTSCLDMQENWF